MAGSCRGESVDARSDIYSLGCVLYELLSGRPPFLAPNPVSMMHLHVNQPPADLQQQIPDLPVGLQNVVMRALAKIPARRYQTVADLVLDLSLVRDGHGTEIPETKQEPIHPRAMRANKVIFAIILMAMLTVTFSYLSQAGSRGPLPELTPRSELLSPPKLKELAALQNRTKDRDKQLRNYIEWIDHNNATADPLSLAQAHHAAAILLAQIEPSRDLDAHRRLALDLYEKAVASHPEPTIQNVQLCDFALQRSAELLSATNRWAEVERLQRSRVDRWRKYARVLPTARDQTPPMALALTDLSKTLKREGKNEEALRVATEAVSDQGCSRPRISSAFVLLNAACLNLELRPENPADQPARKLEEHPRSLANKSGKTMLNQALLIVDSCRTGDSVDWFSQAIERLSGLERHELALDVATRAEEFHARRSESAKLSTVCISKGKLLIKLERYREAEKALLKGVSLIRQLDLPDARLVQPYALLAESSLRLGNRVESCKFANASIAAATLMPSNEKISALFRL